VIIICTILGVFPYYLFKKLVINLIKYKIKSIIRNDCLVFDEQQFSKEDFFIRKFKPIYSRSQNINRLFSLIENKIVINTNLAYSDLESKIL